MRSWFAHNLHSLKIALERFRAAPLAALFTVLVIGVALSLPAGLYLTLVNIQQLAGGLRAQTQISVFLKQDTDATAARALGKRLRQRGGLKEVRFVDREEGLRTLQSAGLEEVLAGLPHNPLPHALILQPVQPEADALERLAEELRALPEVDRVNLDSAWAKRLAALMRLGSDLAGMLAILLGLALTAITGNTIRLQIYAQRDEIEVARLIGATHRFIRRPFLHFGALQGLAGGLAAWLIIAVAATLLQPGITSLASSYGGHFVLAGLAWREVGVLLATSTLLGLAGAYVAVGHTVRSLHLQ